MQAFLVFCKDKGKLQEVNWDYYQAGYEGSIGRTGYSELGSEIDDKGDVEDGAENCKR